MSYKHDPRDVTTVLDGHILTGYAEGTMVEAAPEEDRWEYVEGAQGDGTWVRNASSLGVMTFTIKSNSPSRFKLYDLARSERTFDAYSMSPTTVVGGSECKIQAPAGVSHAEDPGEQEWTVLIADYEEEPR